MAHAGVIDLARAIRESNGVEVTVLRPVDDDRADKNFKGLFWAPPPRERPAGSALGQGAERC